MLKRACAGVSVARPLALSSSREFSGCSFCYDFFRSSFYDFRRRSFYCGFRPRSSCWIRICCFLCYDYRRCSCGFFRQRRFPLRPWLCACEWQLPSLLLLSARPSIERQRLCARLCATRSWCSSFPDPIHSSCRRRLPCSPSPKRAVPPHVVRHHASRSLPRCVRLSAAACWCKTTYRPVA